jgi:hypothetical protein
VTDGDWAPIVPATMASRADENIFVLGDASVASAMPKSGFSANSQAKVAANVIRGQLTDSKIFPARFANTCWSLISTDDGVKVGPATMQAKRRSRQSIRLYPRPVKTRLCARQLTKSPKAGTHQSPRTCSPDPGLRLIKIKQGARLVPDALF